MQIQDSDSMSLQRPVQWKTSQPLALDYTDTQHVVAESDTYDGGAGAVVPEVPKAQRRREGGDENAPSSKTDDERGFISEEKMNVDDAGSASDVDQWQNVQQGGEGNEEVPFPETKVDEPLDEADLEKCQPFQLPGEDDEYAVTRVQFDGTLGETELGRNQLQELYQHYVEMGGVYIRVNPVQISEVDRMIYNEAQLRRFEHSHEIFIHPGDYATRIVAFASGLCVPSTPDMLRAMGLGLNGIADVTVAVTTVTWAVMMLSHTAQYHNATHEGWLRDLLGAYIPAIVFLGFSVVGALCVVFSVRRATMDLSKRVQSLQRKLDSLVQAHIEDDSERGHMPVFVLETWDSIMAVEVVMCIVMGFFAAFVFGLLHRGVGVMLGVVAMLLGRFGIQSFFGTEHKIMLAYLNLLQNMIYHLSEDAMFKDRSINFMPILRNISSFRDELQSSARLV